MFVGAQQVIPGQAIEPIQELSAPRWYISWSVDMTLAGKLAQSLPGRLNRVYMYLQSALALRVDDLAERLFLLIDDVVSIVLFEDSVGPVDGPRRRSAQWGASCCSTMSSGVQFARVAAVPRATIFPVVGEVLRLMVMLVTGAVWFVVLLQCCLMLRGRQTIMMYSILCSIGGHKFTPAETYSASGCFSQLAAASRIPPNYSTGVRHATTPPHSHCDYA